MNDSSPDIPARKVRCPHCGGPSLYAPSNPFRPFCSRRCKLQDLGAWANEEFRIEDKKADDHAAEPRQEE